MINLSIKLFLSSIVFFCAACTSSNEPEITDLSTTSKDGFDWRDSSIVTPAKNQAGLGSCGVFAAVAVMEAQIKKSTGLEVDLSEQYYINASDSWSDNGVGPHTVYDFILENGMFTEAELPYAGRKTASLPAGIPDYQISGHDALSLESFTLEQSVEQIKNKILEIGPVAAAMDFKPDLRYYQNGIYIPDENLQVESGHWVVLCGWRDDPEVLNGGYWIVKNSAGTNWGENGFFKIPYGNCNIDRYVIMYCNL